jgi:hypothetical protein
MRRRLLISTSAVTANPKSIEAYYGRARANLMLGQRVDALSDFNFALFISTPKSARSYVKARRHQFLYEPARAGYPGIFQGNLG